MPLILAIEPDRRQAAQLSGVVRKRLEAELILVETTEKALDAIGNRMPDLVLVPALLSPQDDAALAAALRVIAAAAHVQMLTIPVLGSARPTSRAGGMLSSLRRGKTRAAEPEGCDPSVFADQIASYLEAAAQERPSHIAVIENVAPVASAAAAVRRDADPVQVAPSPTLEAIRRDFEEPLAEAPEETLAEAPAEFAETFAALPDESAAAPSDDGVSIALEEAVRALFADAPPEPAAERPAAPSYQPQAASYTEPFQAFDDTPAVEAASAAIAGSEFDDFAALPVLEVQTPQLEVDEPFLAVDTPLVESDALMMDAAAPVLERESPIQSAESSVSEFEAVEVAPPSESAPADEWAAVDQLMAALQAMPLSAIEMTAPEEWIAPVPPPRKPEWRVIEPPSAKPVAAAPAKSEREWVALIESLRSDVERLRTERAEKAEKPARKEPPPAPRVVRPVKAARPIQDEWGFFDPQQCGFAALLAKLDEVTDSEDSAIQVVNR
jgi:hypothetical protein